MRKVSYDLVTSPSTISSRKCGREWRRLDGWEWSLMCRRLSRKGLGRKGLGRKGRGRKGLGRKGLGRKELGRKGLGRRWGSRSGM